MKIDDKEMEYVRLFYGKFQAAMGMDEDGCYLLNNYYPDIFLHFYDSIMESLPFKRQRFDEHDRVKKILKELELDIEAFWNLIVYLYDYTNDACKNLLATQPSSEERLNELADFVNNNKLTSVTIVTENKKKLTITDPAILKGLDFSFDAEKLSIQDKATFNLRPCIEMDKEDSRRNISYFFSQHLIQFFGLEQFDKIQRRKGASVSNKEKELILSLLYVCKFMDNYDSYLDTGYFNKLMKDYNGEKMNLSDKYEMTTLPY